MNLELNDAAETYLNRFLDEYNGRDFRVFHFDRLLESIKNKDEFNLVWMTDDIIESYFDLLVIENLLLDYNLKITRIPKNGRYGNDASHVDINKMLSPALEKFMENGRLKLNKEGPLMAAANLRKLSKSHAEAILNSNTLVLKVVELVKCLTAD